MRKNLFIVLGRSNSHKSSVVRCLTGCAVSRGNWMIKRANGTDEAMFHVFISSPQERNNTGISVQQFIAQLEAVEEENILLTLQSTSSTEQLNGEVYLQAIEPALFHVQTIACFDPGANLAGFEAVQFNTACPSNETASELRRVWEFL
jgi:hypothetical protein